MAGLYFPRLYYSAYRLGLTSKPVIGNAELVMRDGWFPLISSESSFFRFLSDSSYESGAPGIALVKVNGWKPGISDSMIIISRIYPDLHTGPAKKYLRKKIYPWGSALVFDPAFYSEVMMENEKEDEIVIIEDFGLVIHLENLASLNEIIDINNRNNRGQQPGSPISRP
jgi:hypothetical protein